MPRRSSPRDPLILLTELRELLYQFEEKLAQDDDIRNRVLALIPAVHLLRDLGSSLIPKDLATAARDRILVYFLRYPQIVISESEVIVVAGISEWARRLRELRVEHGWKIVSGNTIRAMIQVDDVPPSFGDQDLSNIATDDYILLSSEQDLEAAYRWHIANDIRKQRLGTRDKLLEYFRANVGKRISGEELAYIAKDATEWARRVRELRTEYGWPIFTKQTGRPDLKVGEYVLEADRQSYVHDRRIPDDIRRLVLQRDNYHCTQCNWSQSEWNSADPRFLELHHLVEHAKQGKNEVDNLITVCNRCHDRIHAKN